MKVVNLKELRAKRNMKQIDLAKAMSVSRSTVAMWESGTDPGNDMLERLADFFGVTTDYLLGRDEKKPAPLNAAEDDDDELWEIREELRRRPEMRVLFSTSKKATKEDLLRAIKIIEALREESGRD